VCTHQLKTNGLKAWLCVKLLKIFRYDTRSVEGMKKSPASGLSYEVTIALRNIEASFTTERKSAMAVQKHFAKRKYGRVAVQCSPNPGRTRPLDAENYET
jgi:hypothetical protein